MEEKKLKKVKNLANKLLKLMEADGEVETSWDEANEAVRVQIESADSGLLIGRHGATIEALQVVLAAMVQKAEGEWVRVICNVGDWRERREEALVQLAMNTAKRVKFSQEEQEILGLTPGERRIVHMTLAGDKEVETESVGEGEQRVIMVKPKG